MGAAATSPAVRPETEPRPKRLLERPKPRFGVRLSRRAAILFVMVCVVLAFAVAPLRALLAQRAQLRALEQQAQVLEEQNNALTQRISRLNDPAYLERLARECLGMVKPGETAFVIVPPPSKSNDC